MTEPTDWSKYDTCPECGIPAGDRCENGRSGRWLARPHRGRPRLPTPRKANAR